MGKITVNGKDIPVKSVHTLIIGSGAAGLNAAVRLHNSGVTDIVIVTEGIHMGTSINTGSDKQTYYKLGLYAEDNDSPVALAGTFYNGGSMHGDIALVEAALSARAFYHLVNIGVEFPRDQYGQFIGYKTDHDPLRRATSYGPYTSREMCLKLVDEVKRNNIRVQEDTNVAALLATEENGEKRAVGAIALNGEGELEIWQAENTVFAVGGPGGLYETSVYPSVHTGAIGLALQAGAKARNLPEAQYGMASIKFRWNVSGTYMQVLPRFISTAADGVSDEREFLTEYFDDAGKMNSMIFLKGYQWPFDTAKAANGSSIIDLLVYRETALRGRRVFLDFRRNSSNFNFDSLDAEAYEYLEKSHALFGTPIERLRKMNPPAISLYEDHSIHIVVEPLEIAVCAQHNNGGLAGNIWWESENIKHLFPIGEVNGSHGVCRPGGSALNSGQVAGFRCAEFIAAKYNKTTFDEVAFATIAEKTVTELSAWINKAADAETDWKKSRLELQHRMTVAGAHVRSEMQLRTAVAEAWKQYKTLKEQGCGYTDTAGKIEAVRNIQLCLAHAVYLEATLQTVVDGVGSRGSALVVDEAGSEIPGLDSEWNFIPENTMYRNQVMESTLEAVGQVTGNWQPVRELPICDGWFENVWADYREGRIYE
ncbi:MAG: FAD-binding protein [Victivallaceae bacterium]|nr:FAD-binding protein [Victivallaceae bacterium]